MRLSRHRFVLLLSLFGCTVALKSGDHPKQPRQQHFQEVSENTEARQKYEWLKLHDPKTRLIPSNIRARELAFSQNQYWANKSADALAQDDWLCVGPRNVGGRTRQIAVDLDHHNTLLVASAQGGVWRSTDRGITWTRTTPPDGQFNATCIVQDPHADKRNIWYYGTGELLSTTFRRVSEVGLPRWRTRDIGNGIWRSTDSGKSWTALTKALIGKLTNLDSPVDGIWSIVIDPRPEHNVIYAAGYGAILESTNDGASWSSHLQDTLHPSFCTDVAVSSTGVVYAALSQYSVTGQSPSTQGIYRSIDGVNWTNITPVTQWPTESRRMKLAIAPSDHNSVYLLMETPNNGVVNHSIFHYTYLSGNGSGPGGSWSNRSSSIPIDQGGQNQTANFNSLGGYALTLAVKPNDANTVFIGGTNLYRSTDGFATTANTTWIGGYNPNPNGPQAYPGHHPDNHTLVFDPDDPNGMYSGTDGGIFHSPDNRDSVIWQNLNNSYLTTIFYSVTVDPVGNNDHYFLGGLQDNGSWSGSDLQSDWESISGGDGCYSAVADNKRHIYTCSQFANIYRSDLDAFNRPAASAYVTPDDSVSGFSFVAPWRLDPNNTDRMYLAATNVLWRNNDLTSIPVNGYRPTPIGWTQLKHTFLPDTSIIGAVAVSKQPASIVYYGTSDGRLFRLDSANVDGSQPIEITSKLFPNAFICSIAIDPHDANQLIVVFSNYGVQSLFASTDGGQNWHNASGSLEEHPDGSGDGPSCRWASIMHTPQGVIYYIGTTTGLYSTRDSVLTASTNWIKEGASTIGDLTVEMVETREADQLVAIATQGHGIFTTNAQRTVASAPITDRDQILLPFPNPASTNTTLPIQLGETGQTEIILYDETGRVARSLHTGVLTRGHHEFLIDLNGLAKGAYYFSLTTAVNTLRSSLIISE
jgi:photosystem II stability/assembly factor-like uncharacterized protein